MSPPSWITIALALAACASSPSPARPTAASAGAQLARLRVATRDEAGALLGRSDGFTQRMSPADRSFRLKQPLPITEPTLLSFAAAQAQDFTPAERARIERARAAVEAGLAQRGLSLAPFLPPEVLVIKTTGAEEFEAPYTRQHAIVLPAPALARMDDDLLRLVIAHELWHVVARRSPALRDATYAVIGTTAAPGFTIPAEIAARSITNPDGPDVAFRMSVQLPGGSAWVMALLEFNSPGFVAGASTELDKIFRLRFLELVPDGAGSWRAARDASGALVTHDPGATPLAACYGVNTEEIIHPDEIVASSFALLAVGERPGHPKPGTPALLDDLAAVIADGAQHMPEVRCRYGAARDVQGSARQAR